MTTRLKQRYALLLFFNMFLGTCGLSNSFAQDTVVSDGAVAMDYATFEELLTALPPALVAKAAVDVGERYTLINELMLNLKLVALADSLEPGDEGYLELKSQLDQVKQRFAFEREMGAFQVPDLRELARERYNTQRDKYARIPETRASSHILLYSPPGPDRTELRKQAQSLLDELRDGASFEDMVMEYSGDPGSKARGGSIDKWASFSDPTLSPPYLGALFEIDEVGDYSEVTDTQFGIHIIRLDGIRESSYKAFDEVQNAIYSDLVSEYQGLASKSVRAKFELSDEAFIDGAAMEELFAPYK